MMSASKALDIGLFEAHSRADTNPVGLMVIWQRNGILIGPSGRVKNLRNTVQAAIKAARWIRLKQGKDVRAIGTSVVSSEANPALIVEHKTVSLRLTAHGVGATKVLKRSTGKLSRRKGSDRRKGRPPPIQA